MRDEQIQMNGCDLTVKCLKCKSVYEFKAAIATLSAVFVEDDFGVDFFDHYSVLFTDSRGVRIFIADVICGTPKRCSVFGRLSTGDMFALPWLEYDGNGGWVSHEDHNKTHLAMKSAPSLPVNA